MPAAAPAAAAPLRVAIVGAGPAGFYAAEALLKQTGVPVQVDVIDRSPAPYGLVRDGVAPDHASKAAAAIFDRVAADPAFRYLGNVRVGTDVTAAELSRLYDRVIYATGAGQDKTLEVPGENLQGVLGASELYGWYNGRPGAAPLDLSGRRVVVIGAGPVAADAARILAQDPKRLAHSDMPAAALVALRKSSVSEIHLLSRRGPESATMSSADAAELGALPNVHRRFHAEPVAIVGENGRAVGVKVRNADGTVEVVPADMVIRAIGQRGTPLPGVPYDAARGVIPTDAGGRVVDPASGRAVPGVYAAGWAKRGAHGTIIDQRADAQATVRALLADAAGATAARAIGSLDEVLSARGARPVSWSEWKTIDRREREAGMAALKAREKFSSGAAMLAVLDAAKAGPAAPAPTARSTQGALSTTINGVVRPLAYNPALGVRPLWKEAWDSVRHLPSRLASVIEYARRVRASLDAISDEDLRWSLDRFGAFENQEGILRRGNRELVHDWKPWTAPNLPSVAPDDFAGASLSRVSLRKIFKQAMDREEPTRAYQYTSAMNLHNYLPRVAHFMGVTMQERVIAVALKGEPPQRSVWAAEEERHGNILETVYNLSREPGQPELREQGIAPTSPQAGERSARSMLANRALAEIGAATGYLVLKSNARRGSPTDLALEGIFRDEVYHYVLMDAARKWGFGIRSRWSRLANTARYYFDNPLPAAVDAAVHERSGFSPLAVFEVAYAFYQIDKRVDRFLLTIPDEAGRRAIGKVYRHEAEVRAAIARGEHSWTDPFSMEANPEMSAADVAELSRRFPGRFNASRRFLRADAIRGIVARYRASLGSPSYWMRKKGFRIVSEPGANATSLERTVGSGEDTASVHLLFKPGEPVFAAIRVGAERRVLYVGPLSGMSMRQLGAIFSAEGARSLADFEALKTDYTPSEIAGRLLDNPLYRANPIPVLEDGESLPAVREPALPELAAAVAARPYKGYMCLVCGYKYSEKDGDPEHGIAPGTRWEDVPEGWTCPECGESKAAFEEDMVEVKP